MTGTSDAPVVAVVGPYIVDMIVRPVPHLPDRGQLMFVDDISIAGGGAGFASSIILQRLGARVYSAGALGRDGQGAQMRTWLEDEGVDVNFLTDVDGPTSSTVVVVGPDGERSYLHAAGASAKMRADLSLLDVPGLTHVHIGGSLITPGLDVDEGGVRLVQAARERGVRTSYDTSWDGSGRWHRVLPYLEHLDVFCPSLVEARQVTDLERAEDVATWIRDRGTAAVVVHAGEDGAYVSSADYTGWIPANKIDVYDTTGAGEAFDAGLVFGLVSGWPIQEAAQLGCACGALATTKPGCVAGVTSLDAALDLVRS